MYTVILLISMMLSDQDLNTLKHLKLEGVSTRETIASYESKIKTVNQSILKETQSLATHTSEKSTIGSTMTRNGCSKDGSKKCNHEKKGSTCYRLKYQKLLVSIELSNANLKKHNAELTVLKTKLKETTDRYTKIVAEYKTILAKQ
jgi:hypothetical protein